jgi:hypothetical protein
MNKEQLLALLKLSETQETSYVERKPATVNKADIRREACAFANSTPPGEESILFLGIHDRTGRPTGIANLESLHKNIHEALKLECFPPIVYSTVELQLDGQVVLAVRIPASSQRPHFTGHAYIRVGSSTRNASVESLDEMILSRTDKCRELLRHKNAGLVSVHTVEYKLGLKEPMRRPSSQRTECMIVDVTAHIVKLYEPASGYTYSESIHGVTIGYDDAKRRLLLVVRFPPA